jgi:hypothetical protein
MNETLKILDDINVAEIAKSQPFRLQKNSKTNGEEIYRIFGIFEKPQKESSKDF